MHIAAMVLGGLAVLAMALFAFLRHRFVARLRRHPAPVPGSAKDAADLNFTYQSCDDPALQELRQAYRLDRIAGQGNEFERMLSLMRWVHSLAKHGVNPKVPTHVNALTLIRLCKEQGKRLNCWMFATILTDVYLSMGYAARIVHLLPHQEKPKESHFVTAVYSNQHQKWIMMDPDAYAYICDREGIPLSVAEIRAGLTSRESLNVNRDIDLYCGRLPGRWLRRPTYRAYLAKNFFRYYAPLHSEFDLASHAGERTFVEWWPQNYRTVSDGAPRKTRRGDTVLATRSVESFWRAPVQE